MKKILLFITILFLSSNVFGATYFINEQFNEFIVKGLSKCSEGKINKNIFIKYKNFKDGTLDDPDGYVYFGKNIDENCLKESLAGDYVKINSELRRSDENYYEDVLIEQYDNEIIFENGSIVIKDNKFWYFFVPTLADNYGVTAHLNKSNQDMVLIAIGVGNTHTRNFVYNTIEQKTLYLINGLHSFEKNYILIEGSKAYKDGAFWHSLKINYNNEVIELINAVDGGGSCTKGNCVKCFSEDKYLSEDMRIAHNIKNYLEKNRPKEWCVYF